MLHTFAGMRTPYDECDEADLADELVKPCQMKGRGRAHSDDLSTAAPSPEASPLIGPQHSMLDGPEELMLPAFQLPDAQECSEAEFELAGFEDDESTGTEFECRGLDDSKESEGGSTDVDTDEDIESEVLDLLSELAAIRAQERKQHESVSSLQKIPYPQLESGFLPTQIMPMQSWLLPPGCAQTGQWAYAMAPRPGFDSMEPLNIVLGEAGVTLTVEVPEECWSESFKQRRASESKAIFRRRRGRSRSPLVSMDEMEERRSADGHPRARGRPRFWTHG